MIDRQLRSIPWRNEFQVHLAMESYMLTYLASYNLATIPARTLEAFQRAFGNVSLHPFQRVGQSPAFILAVFRDDNQTPVRITIAIEGSSTLTQIMSYGVAGWAQPTGLSGRVIQYASTYGLAIKAALAAMSGFPALWNTPGVNCIVAGYSLGGAVAEVLSALMVHEHPNRQHKLFTYGCPRVGTAAWQTANQTAPSRQHYYCQSDPIAAIPATQQAHVANVFSDAWVPLIAFVAPQNPRQRFSLLGNPMSEASINQTLSSVYHFSTLALTSSNPWTYHQKDSYRLMFCNMANVDRDALYFRMLFLEFPDDNQWGVLYRPGTTDAAALHQLSGTNPADASVDLPDYEFPGSSEGGGGDGDVPVDGFGGGDDGAPERPIVRTNPNIRVRTRARW